MTNTEELRDVAREFALRYFTNSAARSEAMLQEIVDLRNKVYDLQFRINCHTDGNGFMDYNEH